MDLFFFLETHTVLTLSITLIISLVIGSFLNVVITRLPNLLETAWRQHCHEFLDLPVKNTKTPINLMTPRSYCPQCHATLKAWHNIPLLSFILLKGKCANCRSKIPLHYPIVEILTAIVTVLVIYQLGLTWQAMLTTLFSWGLIALSFIDIQKQILPDTLTLSLLWLGLLANAFTQFTTPQLAIIGAVSGYLTLWAIAKIFKCFRKKEGMGYGDFKMLAMIGAWIGAGLMLNALLTAVLLGTVISLLFFFFNKLNLKQPIPFGPFLAIGAWTTLLYGPSVMQFIFNYVIR